MQDLDGHHTLCNTGPSSSRPFMYSYLPPSPPFVCLYACAYVRPMLKRHSAIIVTAVFWGLLSSPDTMSTVYSGKVLSPFFDIPRLRVFASSRGNISVHAMNLAFAILEVFLTNIPPMPWMALPCNIVFLAGYLGVAYITYGTQGFYSTCSLLVELSRPIN